MKFENKVSNFLDLYGDDDHKVYRAVLEKRRNILRTFYVRGTFEVVIGPDGKNHYPLLESLLNEAIYFSPILFEDEVDGDQLTRKENELITNKMYRLSLFDEMTVDQNIPFWLEFDLNRLSDQDFQLLAANLFPAFSLEEIKTIGTLEDEFVDALKVALRGVDRQYYLILEEAELSYNQISFPYLSNIHISKDLEEELKEVLLSIANHLNVEARYY